MAQKGKSLYRKLVPKFIRKQLDSNRNKKTILDYYASLPETELNEEEKNAINYLKYNKLSVFPQTFPKEYNRNDIQVFTDDKNKLRYIIFEGKRLYFKRKSSERGIKRNYNYLRIEQDLNSPHRYLTDDFTIGSNDILVDVGAAEGNLALAVIEKVKKVYLFETDENWIEALNATFAPWKDKVEIVNKFVSNQNAGNHVSLAQFFKDKEVFTFLKVDAEGSDEDVLNGCSNMLSSEIPLKLAVCCYHKPNDEHKFNDYLSKRGFSVTFSDGYMIFDEQATFFPPYLRKGILRAVKPAKNFV
ncbi:MAG: hypothetical protein ACOYN4_16690 [Bacteroidales bacterium]